METHIKMDDLGEKPTIFGNTQTFCLVVYLHDNELGGLMESDFELML